MDDDSASATDPTNTIQGWSAPGQVEHTVTFQGQRRVQSIFGAGSTSVWAGSTPTNGTTSHVERFDFVPGSGGGLLNGQAEDFGTAVTTTVYFPPP